MAKNEEPQLEGNFTLKDVLQLIQEMQKGNREDLITAIAEMKKPTAAEQKKIDDDNARLAKNRENRRREMILEEKSRTDRQKACSHQKKLRNGGFGSAWNGQVCSDGYWYPICTQCHLVGPEVKAPVEWLRGGVNAGDMENPIWAGLKLETLYEWQKRTGGPKQRVKPGQLTEAEKQEALATV